MNTKVSVYVELYFLFLEQYIMLQAMPIIWPFQSSNIINILNSWPFL